MDIEEILESLKRAILDDDMDGVCSVYEAITGEVIERPVKKPLTIKEQLALKLKNTPKPPPQQQHEPVTHKPLQATRKRKGEVYAGEIKFIDEQGFALTPDEVKELEEAKKELGNDKPFVKTRRPPARLISVVCKKCGNTYDVPPSYVKPVTSEEKSSFTCNSCIVG